MITRGQSNARRIHIDRGLRPQLQDGDAVKNGKRTAYFADRPSWALQLAGDIACSS